MVPKVDALVIGLKVLRMRNTGYQHEISKVNIDVKRENLRRDRFSSLRLRAFHLGRVSLVPKVPEVGYLTLK